MLARLAAAEVLSGLYEAIADHTQFDGFLTAMDGFIEADPEGIETGNADWKRMFREHFERAGQFLDLGKSEDLETPIVYLERQVVPAATVNRNLDIVASNQLFVGLLGDAVKSLSGLFSSPNDERRLSDLLRSNTPAPPVLISLSVESSNAPIFVVASMSNHLQLQSELGPLITIKVAKATWNPELSPLLETAYGLTGAEIEILEGLIEYGALSDVAEKRGRSIRTVRTQLTHIFGKLGISSQTELALFLATLTQLMTKERRPSEISADWSTLEKGELSRHTIETKGHRLSYIKYGDPSGEPILLIHSTTPPEMTPEFRIACRQAGLLMIGCHKPGAAGGTVRSQKDGPNEMASHYAAVLDVERVDSAIVAGHCSGGLYALAAAEHLGRRAKGVLLLDTGVPIRSRKDLMRLPKSMRRTFIPARYMPEILLVPHRIFAANFKRSAAGEAHVVDYFFQDSPIDQELTRIDRKYYEVTRQIIEYSFSDVDRLVADVCRWARDWSDALALREKVPCAFVHGDANTMFRVEEIESIAGDRDDYAVFVSPEMGQLHVYQDPSAFLAAANWLAGRELNNV
ncbi:MAG: alpha/beta fold hydrolase [Pseudomonadota bacterium]